MKELAKNVRKHMRYRSDPSTVTFLATKLTKGKFSAEQLALVQNESFKGCCLVIQANKGLSVGNNVWIQLGELEPMECEIRWIEMLTSDVYKVGLYYLD